ncbi:hypothetical protein [Microbacterium sp. NPDC057944]|uniref:hypothetical protein n=1 Tax=Microbacterium sp. NPDC057944 TaxID=3346286 RepID=UPI0036DA319E
MSEYTPTTEGRRRVKIIRSIICIVKGHDYTTWRRAIRPGGQVPMAACDRCGMVP